jgi:protease IV
MWTFLKGIWRFLVGVKEVVITLLVVGLVILLLRSLLSGEAAPLVPDGGALRISLDGYVVEQRAEVDPVAALTNPAVASLPPQILLRDLLEVIDTAAKDKRIKLITLDMDGFAGAGPATLGSIGEALDRFRKSGKQIMAHGLYYSNGSYRLAAHANRISLDPMGMALVTGYGSYNLYMKEALDKLRVNVNVFRVGKYKSAVEPYSRSDMSPEAREETQALLDVLWEQYRSKVERLRGGKLNLQTLIDTMPQGVSDTKGSTAQFALASKLVDVVQTRQQYEASIAKIAGEDDDEDGLPSYASIDMDSYLLATRTLGPKTGDSIAVVYAAGEIIDGDQPAGVAGGDTVARLIRQAAADDATKAIVLRIDSPGGSVTASEEIRRALEEARAKKLPVIASMGSLAASGGYWIATGTDMIFAEPGTITGSIGIFGMIPTFENTAKLVGVKSDGVGTTQLSSAEDIAQAISPPVKALIQSTLQHGYDEFLGHVSRARKMPVAQVDAIAQGRVWAGATAHQLKLVDRFGGLEEALAEAAKRAGLKSWHADYREQPESIVNKLLNMLTGGLGVATEKPALRGAALLPLADQLGRLSMLMNGAALRDRNNLYAYCSSCTVLTPPNLSRARVALAQAGTLMSGK